jgi:hypothetical protein
MTRSNLHELLSVLEKIRASEYPEIPSEVIVQIAVTQYDNQDDRAQARSKTIKIIADFLNSGNEERR